MPLQSERDSSRLNACYKKELAQRMGLSLRTFQRKLEAANIAIPRGLVPPDLQKVIFETLGWHEMA